jgi:hypothetical protein
MNTFKNEMLSLLKKVKEGLKEEKTMKDVATSE